MCLAADKPGWGAKLHRVCAVLGGMDLGTLHEAWTNRGDGRDTDGQPQDRDSESEQVKVSNRKKSALRCEGGDYVGEQYLPS